MERVGASRRVAQEVVHRGEGRAVAGRQCGRHRYRLVEPDLALFDALEHQRCAERAREVCDVERRIRRCRDVRFQILVAPGPFPHDPIVLDDRARKARNAGLFTQGVEIPFEPRGEEV